MMNKKIISLIASFIISFTAIGQKAFVGITPLINFSEYLGRGHGLNAYAGYQLSPALTLGASAGRVNYQNLVKPYHTIALHLNSAIPVEGDEKHRVLVVIEPGWGFYDETFYERNDPKPYKREGGFSIFGGLGITVPVYKKVNLLLMGGYVNAGIEQPDFIYAMGGGVYSAEPAKYYYGGFSFRIGLMMN